MKACRVCGRLYPDEAGFCQADGQELYNATDVPVPSDDEDPRVGQLLFERYQIRRVVADGGMGRVYEALDMQQRRNVAVKILHPAVAGDEVAVERFKREFEVSRQLPNMHIVDVIDFHATGDGSYALVMEFLYGEELRATLKREKRIDVARAVRMVSQVALGMDDAHSKKLVHRDLKPDNIFLCQTSNGDISKILDFGSVKDKGENAKKLTALGTTIGSPYYMAPEQAQGLDTLDHRADVWALAAIFYESVTGTVPFNGVNGPSILLEILTKEPRPPSLVDEVAGKLPPGLDRAVLKALKKTAAVRTNSIGEFADDVGHACGLEGDHTQWATKSQDELQQEMQAQWTQTMSRPSMPVKTQDVASDEFFGESDSLGMMDAMDAAFAAAGQGVPQVPSSAELGAGASEAPGTDRFSIPTRSTNWVVPVVAVGIVAAIVIMVLVL